MVWKKKTTITWKDFEYGLKVRFGPDVYDDATGELTKLCQTSTVKCYQEKFKELANRTHAGLKEEIKARVQMFRPITISQAIGLARLQEETTEAVARKSIISAKTRG